MTDVESIDRVAASARPPHEPTASRIGEALRRFPERGVIGALVVVTIGASLVSNNFLNRDNLFGIAQDVTFLGFIVVGVSVALIAGEIDLSVGSVFGLTSCVTAILLRDGHSPTIAIAVGLLVGAAAGAANGIAALLIGVPGVIVTLASLGIYRGITLVLTNTAPVTGMPSDHFLFDTVGNATVLGGLSWLTVILLVYAFLAAVGLAKTVTGFRVYSVGSNREAARLIGMSVARTRVGVMTFSGVCAGLAGVLSVFYLAGASPTGGTGYELDALAAVIIGGVALTGGRGTVLGALIGLVVVGIVRNILVLGGVSPSWQQAVSGGVLLAAVAIGRLSTLREP
jgi:ribose/xylose/arabinose/galactoside ABC-type transport system permease subunit